MNVNITFHYPPELMSLLIDTIPLLNKSKRDVFLFFQGAGVSDQIMQAPHGQWKKEKDSIGKHEITRQILTELNTRGEPCLRERREVLRRIVDFDNFSACWPTDQLKAKGLVAEIRQLVNVKDTFTRMAREREAERSQRLAEREAKLEAIRRRKERLVKVKDNLNALFFETNPQKRGKALEPLLNELFAVHGILIRDAFTLTGSGGEGVVEQIDGVVELDGHLYFVEMKWWEKALGVGEVSQHLVRVYSRSESRAVIISASDFTPAAVTTCKDALHTRVVVLCTLQEIIAHLEKEAELRDLLKRKINAAILDKNPFFAVPQG